MPYIYLVIAIIAEVAATSALKASEEFTKWLPSLIVIVGYSIAFYCLSVVLKSIPVGITYAIWSAMGIALVTIIAAIVYKQVPDLAAVVGILFIVTGVVILNLFSKMAVH